MRSARRSRVFSVPPGVPFLDTVAEALLDGTLVPGFVPARDPMALASATLFVPTRRAARALGAVLAARAGSGTTLLPRILPLGGLEAIETELLFDDPGLDDPLAEELPLAVDTIGRRMQLTRLVLAWAKAVQRAVVAVEPDGTRQLHEHETLLVAASAADAWRLAGELAALADELILEGVGWDALAPLGTEEFDRYWRITLDFLAIVGRHWPEVLAEQQLVDPAARQVLLVEREIARLGRAEKAPVVVIGSTGSSRPTARLIAAIGRLQQGAIVLPGLDRELDAEGWDAVGGPDGAAATHPQTLLKRLLATIGVERAAVRPLGRPPGFRADRGRFVAEALRPADTTDRWRGFQSSFGMLDGVEVLDAPDERVEALGIAIVLREALERPGTAMLVTPDRTIGRRVREELARWSVDVDTSAGEPLAATPAGTFARLLVDVVVSDLGPVEVLALLAHPLARLGRTRSALASLARTLEMAVLRDVLPARALHDPAALLARRLAASRRGRRTLPLDAEAARALGTLLGDLRNALDPLLSHDGGAPLPEWLIAHDEALRRVALTPDDESALSGIDGNALRTLFDGLLAAPEPAIEVDARGYAALFERFTAETPVRGPDRSHPRLKILGLLEARLLSADLVILAGLDEGVWPPSTPGDSFLNRPMRLALGLPPPERRVGQTAHDLTMLMGAPRVLLTRAGKRDGAPTVPSRFLLRMAALAGSAWAPAVAAGRRYAGLAVALDEPEGVAPIKRPSPTPPLALRPAQLSVTRIETLRRDPYAIYADRVLELGPVADIGAPFGPAESGTRFHEAVEAFARANPTGPVTPAATEAFEADLAARFAEARLSPLFDSFDWPRILGWGRGFLDWEAARRAAGGASSVEAAGRHTIALEDGSTFVLTARADRMDVGADGRVTVVDFKTGRAPTPREVRAGFAPQLTLETAMTEQGAFAALGPAEVATAQYVKLTATGAAEVTDLGKLPEFDRLVADHYDGLLALLNAFRDPATGYMARPYPQFANRFGDYDHLARVKEWLIADPDAEALP